MVSSYIGFFYKMSRQQHSISCPAFPSAQSALARIFMTGGCRFSCPPPSVKSFRPWPLTLKRLGTEGFDVRVKI